MPQCAALGCKNKGNHSFPKDVRRRKLWEQSLQRNNWKASDSSRLCSNHFKSDDYYGESAYTGNKPLAKFLRRTAVPSIFPISKKEVPVTPLAIERQARYEDRSQRTLFTSAVTPSTGLQSCIENLKIEIELSTVQGISNLPPDKVTNTSDEKSTQVNFKHTFMSIKRFLNDDKAIAFYTGFESYKKFYYVYLTLFPMITKIQYYDSNVIHLRTEDQLFLTLIKLRRDKCNFELSRFFNVSETTVSNVFITYINFMHQLWKKIYIQAEQDLVQYLTPESFKLSNCSDAHGGSVSDQQTVQHSSLLQKCEPGDSILADVGLNIQDLFANKNITVNISTFLKGKSQKAGQTVKQDHKLASKRVHIERIIEVIKTYKILKNELPHSYKPLASKIFFVCFMCCNFREKRMNV